MQTGMNGTKRDLETEVTTKDEKDTHRAWKPERVIEKTDRMQRDVNGTKRKAEMTAHCQKEAKGQTEVLGHDLCIVAADISRMRRRRPGTNILTAFGRKAHIGIRTVMILIDTTIK